MDITNPCLVAFTTRIMGGRWKARLVWALTRQEPLRFSELRKACPPISDRILTKELKELESWGLIVRRDYEVVPPRTDYCRSELGRTLEPLMAAMADWGLKHRDRIRESEVGADGQS